MFNSRPTIRLVMPTLVVALMVTAPQRPALAESPFQNFLGGWIGTGSVVGADGHREAIHCRAHYADSKNGSALEQSIVCASESYKIDIYSYVENSGPEIQGYWRERVRDVAGSLTGHLSQSGFEGDIVAASFSAAIFLMANGRTQDVDIVPHGGDISKVRVELQRNG